MENYEFLDFSGLTYYDGRIKEYIDERISTTAFRVEIVDELPESGEPRTIYLVPDTAYTEDNVYDEYMYIDEAWECIGTTRLDLETKQDKLTVGENIEIDEENDNTISALGYYWDKETGGFAEKYLGAEGEPIQNIASGNGSHAEGYLTMADGDGAHAEGHAAYMGVLVASGMGAHAEGCANEYRGSGYIKAIGDGAHAEGYSYQGANVEARGNGAHAEGFNTTASGDSAHAEGYHTEASNAGAHAEGYYTTASALYAHAEGCDTEANNTAEHAEGVRNVSHTELNSEYGNSGNTQHSIGIGGNQDAKNALEIMQNGDMYVFGVGGYQGTDTKAQDPTIQTLQEVVESVQSELIPDSGITISGDTINANTEAITIGDIQLSNGAPVDALGIWTNDIIPQGTSVQEILLKLLCREIFPSAAEKPSFTVVGTSFGLKEIGDTVTISDPTVTKKNGLFKASFTTPAQPSVEGVSWSNETSSSAVTGFTVTGASNSIVLGTNKILYTYTKTYSAPNNMPITNLGHPTQSTTQISTGGTDISAIWASSSITVTAATTATGVYPCFSNVNGTALTVNITQKCALTSGTTIEIDVPSEGDNHRHFAFAFPIGRTYEMQMKSLDGTFVPYVGGKVERIETNFFAGTNYKVVETSGGEAGERTYKFIFNKGLNE